MSCVNWTSDCLMSYVNLVDWHCNESYDGGYEDDGYGYDAERNVVVFDVMVNTKVFVVSNHTDDFFSNHNTNHNHEFQKAHPSYNVGIVGVVGVAVVVSSLFPA